MSESYLEVGKFYHHVLMYGRKAESTKYNKKTVQEELGSLGRLGDLEIEQENEHQNLRRV